MVRIKDTASGMSPERFLYTLLFDKEEKMKKYIVLILIVAFLMISFGCTTIASNTPGPAPNSGDGVPDGSGFDGEGGSPDDSLFAVGPAEAPNSGDDISDGNGF